MKDPCLQIAELLRDICWLGHVLAVPASRAGFGRDLRGRGTLHVCRPQGAWLDGAALLAYAPRALLAPLLDRTGH